MVRKYKKKPSYHKKIAKERIAELMAQAKKAFKTSPQQATKYADMARKVAMRFKVRFTSEQKKQICKHCYTFLVPSKNCRVRINEGKIVYYCSNCKKYMRFPYK